ncbi:hypothetical protein [Paenibacillus sp. IHBB 3054]|uniref:hypothetical protein n=1 Tax=Paenibacillus sp. IHBB 3054 TaxID=3425689 RepID=UPI003F663D5E
MKTKYTYLEVESIENDYDEQVPLKVIVENVNRDFHQGATVRTINSVRYVIQRVNNFADEWKWNLEKKWLQSIDTPAPKEGE